MKNKRVFNKSFSILLATGLIISTMASGMSKEVMASENTVKEHDVRTLTSCADISYDESTEQIDNPYIGFYKPIYLTLKREGSAASKSHYNLTHIRCDLSDFSGSFNGDADSALTDDALNALKNTLKNLRDYHCTAIVRFAYHPGFDSKKTPCEPDIKTILGHQQQLGAVLSEYSDVVVCVECGLFGKWGEMHGTSMCNKDNFNQAIDKWLEVLPDNITVNVRTLKYYCDWCGANQSKLSSNITKPGDKEYRVGIFNDGYLGNEDDDDIDTDLGTYKNRTEEINWLKNQATHTLYGGELVTNVGNGNVKNTAAYMETEAFNTHTSYLNVQWNDKAVDNLRKESYSGNDPLFEGKTGFDYVQNRLGYRFVVKGVKLTEKTTTYEDFGMEVGIYNAGFANLVRDKKMSLIFEGTEGTYRFELTNGLLPVTSWNSKELVTIKPTVDLPADMPLGDYKVYLRLADDNKSEGLSGYPIRFANEKKGDTVIWNKELGANLLGSVTIEDETNLQKQEPEVTPTPEVSSDPEVTPTPEASSAPEVTPTPTEDPAKNPTAQVTPTSRPTGTPEVKSVTKPAKVKIKSAKNKKKRKLTVKWKKVKGAAGYELQYSLKKFNSTNTEIKTKKIAKTSITIKKLRKKKKYYIRVRAFKLDSAGNKVYGKWSKVKKVRINK